MIVSLQTSRVNWSEAAVPERGCANKERNVEREINQSVVISVSAAARSGEVDPALRSSAEYASTP